MTDRYEFKRGYKKFNLTTDAGSDRIGFAVRKGGRANKFKPVVPAYVDVTIA